MYMTLKRNAVAVAVAENDTDHVTCKMEPLLQLVKMD